jgi:hypothetical protein
MHRRYRRILNRILAEPAGAYTDDAAMAPVAEEEEGRLELFTATAAARGFMDKRRAQAKRRGAPAAARP